MLIYPDTKFTQILSQGAGDSVEYYQDMWKEKSIEEIHNEIKLAKKTKEI